MFDRFPDLQMVAVECGAGWIPHLLEHMDDHWWRNRVWTGSTLMLLPSEYFRPQLDALRSSVSRSRCRSDIGLVCDNLMWSSDYPIIATTGPTAAA